MEKHKARQKEVIAALFKSCVYATALTANINLYAQIEIKADTAVARQLELNEVTIVSPSRTQTVARQAIRATVLDVQALSNQPVTLTEAMNRSAGVRIRQTGGLGAETSVMLNGFSGKSIRYFKDGVPMDYLGATFNFSVVPVNMIDRVEVYKGVLPVSLGADALGGAVNIISRQTNSQKKVDASYQYGSFNTRMASVNVRMQTKNGQLYGGIDAFYNHSDNDYHVLAAVVDTETAVAHTERLPLFHNRYSSAYTEIYAGLKQQSWTDALRVGLTAFDIARQHNYGATMGEPFGAATSGMYSFIPTLQYSKNLFDDRLTIKQFFAFNTLHTNMTDTVRGRYDWYGKFIPIASRAGEITPEGSLLKLRYRNYTSRSNIAFRLHNNHALEFNAVYTGVRRTGTNPRDIIFQQTGIDILTTPSTLNKWVAALGLKSYFNDGSLSNNLFVKYFYSRVKGIENSVLATVYNQSINRCGVGEAVKYTFNNNLFARLSGEMTVRLPDYMEFFGDGKFVLPNFAINPERSYNVNLGINIEKTSLAALECNIFYRRTYDMILLISSGIMSQYRNVDKVKGIGIELDARYKPLKWIQLTANMTCQDFRLFGQTDPTYEGARLRNTPYFFANAGANVNFDNTIKKFDKLTGYWFYSYVREYYINYIPRSHEPDGWLGLWGKPRVNAESQIIPNQQMHTVGLMWQTPNRFYSIGLEVKNIFDATVFDNYRIQNAGRSFYIKMNLSI